jgi:hypothetical protein
MDAQELLDLKAEYKQKASDDILKYGKITDRARLLAGLADDLDKAWRTLAVRTIEERLRGSDNRTKGQVSGRTWLYDNWLRPDEWH